MYKSPHLRKDNYCDILDKAKNVHPRRGVLGFIPFRKLLGNPLAVTLMFFQTFMVEQKVIC